MPNLVSPEPLDLAPVPPSDTPAQRQRQDAATHLANERTYLAWCFLGIVLMGSGIALARTLIALNTSPLSGYAVQNLPVVFYPTTMGLLFLGAGLLVVILASCRYLSVQTQIIQQRFQPSSSLPLVLLALILGLSIVLAGFLLQLRGTL